MSDSPYVIKLKPNQAPLRRKHKPCLERLDIELTERCNCNCIHCCINLPANDAFARSREMTTEQIKDILRQAAGLGCLDVRFTGGEPLLRPDFEDLYLCARRLGMRVLLFTNARLITPHLADIFSRIPPLANIEVTVYGMRKETYEAVTRESGSFAQFRRGLDLLLDRKVPFIVKTVLLPQTLSEIDEFEAWAKTIPWMTEPPGLVMFLDLRNRSDNTEKDALIKSLRLPAPHCIAVLTRDATRYRREMTEFATHFMGPAGDVLFGCGAGQRICIDAYGRAQPCMGIRAPELTIDLIPSYSSGGHRSVPPNLLMVEQATEVFTLADTVVLFGRLHVLRVSNPEYLRRCARCFLKGLCEQCPAKSWAEYKSLDTPVEYLCEAAHAQARCLGWMDEGEHGWDVVDWQERVGGSRWSLKTYQ